MAHSLFRLALAYALLPRFMYHACSSLVAASPETDCWTAPMIISGSQCLPTGSVSKPVTVGAEGSLVFNPTEIDANIGDVIEFTFLKLNHTLTQSTLLHPCSNVGGFSTGFNQFNPTNNSGRFVVKYLVTISEPQWFFCAQTQGKSHCQAGMVFALNAGDEMSAFQSAASVSSVISSTEQSSMPGTSTTLATLMIDSSTSDTIEQLNVPTTSSTSTAKSFTSSTIEQLDLSTTSSASTAGSFILGQPDMMSPSSTATSSITKQPSSPIFSASQTMSPTPKYQNSTNQTSPRTAIAVPTSRVSISPTASMGTKGEIAAFVSLTLLSVMMLIFVSL